MDRGFLQSIPINVMDALKLENRDVLNSAPTASSLSKMDKQRSLALQIAELAAARFTVPLVRQYAIRKP